MNATTRGFTVLLEKYSVPLLFLLAAVLLLSGIWAAPVYILDEARNAQAAREMMEHREWIVPTFNGVLRSHKPPVHYYFMWLSYSVFGTNAFGARFFSAVMGWLTLFVTWYFTRRFAGKREALWAALVLLLSTHFLFEFRLAVPDPYLIFFVASGIFCFYAYVTEARMQWLILAAISAGLAVLAKGPVALLLPGLSLASWLILTKKQRLLFSWKMLLFMAIVLLVALPWYIAVHLSTHGAFTREFFLQHNIGRFESAMEGHGGNFLVVPLFVFVGLLPLSVFIVEAVRRRELYSGNPLSQLAIAVTLITLTFFCLSGTKLPNYPMPCYPFVAVLTGCYIHRVSAFRVKAAGYPLWILLVLTTVFFAGAIVALKTEPAAASAGIWAFIFMIPAGAAAGSIVLLRKMGLKPALYLLTGGYILFNLLALNFTYPAIYRQNPVTKTLHLLRRSEQVYAYKIYNPAYNFYLDQPVIILQDESELTKLLLQHPTAKVISRAQELSSFHTVPIKVLAKEQDLFERPVTVIFTGL